MSKFKVNSCILIFFRIKAEQAAAPWFANQEVRASGQFGQDCPSSFFVVFALQKHYNHNYSKIFFDFKKNENKMLVEHTR